MPSDGSALQLTEEGGLRLAIVGCGHGVLHSIYASIELACDHQSPPWPNVDLVIIGGDFQAVRNAYDLHCVSMPVKYREMHDFHQYYSGQREAPYLTIFVGGNHEASNYLWELYYGGWVAKRIWYMGAAGMVKVGPLRIMGMSGIWKGFDYRKPHHERLPYSQNDVKSIYHIRELNVRKLLQIRTQMDIGISHDWPRGVEWEGNWKMLFKFKRHLEEDARNGQLGSVAAKQVMDWLRPRWWFSAHLHCKHAALVTYAPIDGDTAQSGPRTGIVTEQRATQENGSVAQNADEIDLDLDEEPVSTNAAAATLPVNTDEIDLELEDDDTDGTAPVASGQGLDGTKVLLEKETSSKALNGMVNAPTLPAEDARAALPASFFTKVNQNGGSKQAKSQFDPAIRPKDITNTATHFLALGKCVPNQHFLQLMPVNNTAMDQPVALSDTQRPVKLEHDKEWLAITRAFAMHEPLVLGDPSASSLPAKTQEEYASLIDEQFAWVDSHVKHEDLTIDGDSFELTAPVYDGGNIGAADYTPANGGLKEYTNPQTARFCEMLQIANPFHMSQEERTTRMEKAKDMVEDEHSGGHSRGGRGRGRGRSRGGFGGRGRGRGNSFRGAH